MRALIVEDEARVAENIAAALRESAGLAVDVAANGPDGVELGRQANYDLIVLDLMLPGMDGLAVLKAIRAKGQTAPVLVLTAVMEKASIVRLLNAGADDYLAKPFDLGELLARAKALIRRGEGREPSEDRGRGSGDRHTGENGDGGGQAGGTFANGVSRA
jgi:DNA-binding response OmpR family regulator